MVGGKRQLLMVKGINQVSQESLIHLECTVCKNQIQSRRNKKGRAATQGKMTRLEIKKFCKWCRKHTLHKETK